MDLHVQMEYLKMKMQIVPLYHRIVVKPQEGNDWVEVKQRFKDATGKELYIADSEKPTQGTVVSIGGGRILNNGAIAALSVRVGDIVVYNRYAGTEVRMDGQNYLVISEDEVACVLRPEINVLPSCATKESQESSSQPGSKN